MRSTQIILTAFLLLVSVPAVSFENGQCLELEGATVEGPQLAQEEHSGWTLVEFWATWCRPCLSSIKSLQSLLTEYESVRLVGVNSEDNLEHVRRFVAEAGWRFSSLWDPEQVWLEDAAPPALPYLLLLDPTGCIVWQGIGGTSNIRELRMVLDRQKLRTNTRL